MSLRLVTCATRSVLCVVWESSRASPSRQASARIHRIGRGVDGMFSARWRTNCLLDRCTGCISAGFFLLDYGLMFDCFSVNWIGEVKRSHSSSSGKRTTVRGAKTSQWFSTLYPIVEKAPTPRLLERLNLSTPTPCRRPLANKWASQA